MASCIMLGIVYYSNLIEQSCRSGHHFYIIQQKWSGHAVEYSALVLIEDHIWEACNMVRVHQLPRQELYTSHKCMPV